jgi:hypothetical protein
MKKMTLNYIDLVELDARRERAEIRQFVIGFVVLAVLMAAGYLVRG